jgi:alpha-galactosidase
MDAGWFRSPGDWYPDPKKFPNGLAPVADEAHRLGLKFGLWADWAQAGLGNGPGALNVHDPKVRGWLVNDLPANWKPEEFKGQTIDIGVPAAQEWAANETSRLVREYKLDMLEHDGYVVAKGCDRTDHPHAPPDPANTALQSLAPWTWTISSNSTDVSYHATNAYYAIQDKLRRERPGLLLEVCNDGGRMVDFGSAAHADYFSITDAYDPLSNRRAFYDASHVLPAAMLETYVEKWPSPRVEEFRYMLRSGMMGWLTVMQDTSAWTSEQHAAAKSEFDFYKRELRPLIRAADLYHISPRPDGAHWDAIEYFDSARGRGAVYVFRGSLSEESNHLFQLRGLNPRATYKLSFRDDASQNNALTGRQLASGLKLRLATPLSSEIILLEQRK